MIALLGTFFFGIGAMGFFNDGKTGSGWVCIVLILISWLISAGAHEDAKARANRRRYWAHYYDRDRVRARNRAGSRGPVRMTQAQARRARIARRAAEEEAFMEEEEFYEAVFDDDEW